MKIFPQAKKSASNDVVQFNLTQNSLRWGFTRKKSSSTFPNNVGNVSLITRN